MRNARLLLQRASSFLPEPCPPAQCRRSRRPEFPSWQREATYLALVDLLEGAEDVHNSLGDVLLGEGGGGVGAGRDGDSDTGDGAGRGTESEAEHGDGAGTGGVGDWWISLLALDDASELTCDHQTESSAGARRRYPRLLPRGGFLTFVRHSIGSDWEDCHVGSGCMHGSEICVHAWECVQ